MRLQGVTGLFSDGAAGRTEQLPHCPAFGAFDLTGLPQFPSRARSTRRSCCTLVLGAALALRVQDLMKLSEQPCEVGGTSATSVGMSPQPARGEWPSEGTWPVRDRAGFGTGVCPVPQPTALSWAFQVAQPKPPLS